MKHPAVKRCRPGQRPDQLPVGKGAGKMIGWSQPAWYTPDGKGQG